MNVFQLFLISVLLVGNAKCDCNTYVDCFGDFLRDFFTTFDLNNVKVNTTKTKVVELTENQEAWSVEKVLSDLTELIKEINKNITQTNLLARKDNKTKIVVKNFELDDDFLTEDSDEISTTTEVTTTEFDIMEELNLSEATTTEKSVDVEKNISVIPLKNKKDNVITNSVDADYLFDSFNYKNFTDYPNIDYIEIYKDTTNEPVEYIPTEMPPNTEYNKLRAEIYKQENKIQNLIEHSLNILDDEALTNIIQNVTNHNEEKTPSLSHSVFPWIAAIYVKNESKGSQFDYFCDGALMSDKAILTAARCVMDGNRTFSPDDFIVILGKTSLQVSSDKEKIVRVQSVKVHGNFSLTNGTAINDLAFLVLEEPIAFSDAISIADLDDFEEVNEKLGEPTAAVSTAWSLPGDLTLIHFVIEKSKACVKDNKVENTFCSTYGNVPFCPSFGGLYVIQRLDKLYLRGIRTGDPLRRGYCINRDVTYTSLQNYAKWISDVVGNKA